MLTTSTYGFEAKLFSKDRKKKDAMCYGLLPVRASCVCVAADLRKLHSLDPRPCPVCNRMYSNLSNLRQHMRLIHNPQSVTCPLCNKPFKTKLYLKRHLVSFHELSVADRHRQEEIYQQQQRGSDTQTPPAVDSKQQNISATAAAAPSVAAATPSAPPPQPCVDENASTASTAEQKLRAFQNADNSSYTLEVAQLPDTKNFVGGMIQQFNATFN